MKKTVSYIFGKIEDIYTANWNHYALLHKDNNQSDE